ncbi:MAG: hypothetical protein HW416_1041 [Chloroflexi bacterium]|nr:hypothetical protein [Chloroflexota bacterium]
MEPVRARLVHSLPGRIRARVPREQLTPQVVAQLTTALLELADIFDVTSNLQTGSLVIWYDATQLDTSGLIELVREAGLYILDVISTPQHNPQYGAPSEVASLIQDAFRGFDARLGELSEGKVDLRSAFPIALGALAARQFLANPGQLGAAPWYVIAWYALDSFWKFNSPSGQTTEPTHEVVSTAT